MNFTTLSGGSGLTHFEGGCGGGNSFSEISILVSVTKNNLVSMLIKLFFTSSVTKRSKNVCPREQSLPDPEA
jgi:hypothetical protein